MMPSQLQTWLCQIIKVTRCATGKCSGCSGFSLSLSSSSLSPLSLTCIVLFVCFNDFYPFFNTNFLTCIILLFVLLLLS